MRLRRAPQLYACFANRIEVAALPLSPMPIFAVVTVVTVETIFTVPMFELPQSTRKAEVRLLTPLNENRAKIPMPRCISRVTSKIDWDMSETRTRAVLMDDRMVLVAVVIAVAVERHIEF